MPLPTYQPVKKKLKSMSPSLDSLDDYCTSRIIAHALVQSKSREQEPYVGDNMATERNLSLVCKRWYFLTQTQVADHGVHKIDLESVLKREPKCKHLTTKLSAIRMNGAVTAVRTPRRMMPSHLGPTIGAAPRTPVSSIRMRANYGILSQRNMTTTNSSAMVALLANKQQEQSRESFSIRLLRAVQPKLLKYKHVQLTGTITADDFAKLIVILSSSRIEKLDLIGVHIVGAKGFLNDQKRAVKSCPSLGLNQLETLTYTISIDPKDDPTNALLWTIYQQAANLRELRVYVAESNQVQTGNGEQETAMAACDEMGVSQLFVKKLGALPLATLHPRLARLVFDRIPNDNPQQAAAVAANGIRLCPYGTLLRKVLSEEKSLRVLETNDNSLVHYLVQTSNRLCTRLELPSLCISSPIRNLDLLYNLVRLHNLGSKRLEIHIDNFDQIGEVRSSLEGFGIKRPPAARCLLNFFLLDQKFTDPEDKVKQLIQICRMADVRVHFTALQRISIDCCHLMWSAGRALQAILQAATTAADVPGTCIFKITLQTYPIKPNTVNPFEITIPFGRCPQYQISSTREDIARHREIMRALKKECYHQFVKSVRENN